MGLNVDTFAADQSRRETPDLAAAVSVKRYDTRVAVIREYLAVTDRHSVRSDG
jgi:hypothetical protein